MEEKSYSIKGNVLSSITKKPLAGIRVEAWDMDLIFDDLLGSAVTDQKGLFSLTFKKHYYRELFERKPDVYFKVFYRGQLITSTEDHVLWNLSEPDKAIDIYVDMLQTPDHEKENFVVYGKVVKGDGSPQCGLRVKAFDKQLKHEILLGETDTDEKGKYKIQYQLLQLGSGKSDPDLIIRVYGSEKSTDPLASSPLILNALQEEEVNLIIGEETYAGRTEYTVIEEALAPFLANVALEQLDSLDYAYLESKTSLNVEQIVYYLEALNFSAQTQIDPQFFFGLFKMGYAINLIALTATTPNIIGDAVKRAGLVRYIRELNDDEIESAINILQQRIIDDTVHGSRPVFPDAQKLLRLSQVNDEEKHIFVQAYLNNNKPIPEFWEDLKQTQLGEQKTRQIKFVFDLSAITLNNMSLVESLSANQAITKATDLAAFSQQDWLQQIQQNDINAPEFIPGESAGEKQLNYALLMTRLSEDAFPTAFMAHRWSHDDSMDQNVSLFLLNNPDFDFDKQSITTYLAEHDDALAGFDDPDSVRTSLKDTQKLFRISPRFQRFSTVKALWLSGLYSARAVKAMGRKKFSAQFLDTLGATTAYQVYDQASKVSNMSLMTLAKYWWDTNTVSPYVIPETNLKIGSVGDVDPTLASLFGSLDFCDCRHCRSVLSPAAYLVDLLAFLNSAQASDEDTALEKLFARRPDIGNIELNCENTNTPLPYLDLVNEVLEDAVIPRTYIEETHDDVTVYVADVPQTEEDDPRVLQANPEHINTAAYETLIGESYPWQLPFNLWAEEARAYLDHLGVKRYDIMKIFNGTGASSPNSIEVSSEVLGLIPQEKDLLTHVVTNTSLLETLWGVSSGGLINTLEPVENFLKHANLNLAELKELLECQYINPAENDQVEIAYHIDFPCALEYAKLTNLSNSRLDRMHRFIRLRNKLRWDLTDVDKVLTAFAKNELDDELLEFMAKIHTLLEKYKVNLETVLGWWSEYIDTVDYENKPSLYRRLFLNKSVGEYAQIVIDTLTLNATGDELSATDKSLTDADFEPVILGATNISSEELALVIEYELGGNATLNLRALSHIYRISSMSRLLKLSVDEFLSLKQITGLQAVTTPTGTAAPGDTKAIIEASDVVKLSKKSIAELAYLLVHNSEPLNLGSVMIQSIAQRLRQIRQDLSAIRDDNQMPSADLDTVLANKLALILADEAEVIASIQIVVGISPLSEAEQKAFIVNHWGDFIDTIEAQDQLVPPVNALGSVIDARLTYVLQPLLDYLIPLLSSRYLIEHFKDELSVSTLAAALLLERLQDPNHAGRNGYDVFQAETFINSDTEVNPGYYDSQFKLYERLEKVAQIINMIKVSDDDIEFLIKSSLSIGWLDFNNLPLSLVTDTTESYEIFNRFAAMVLAHQVDHIAFIGDLSILGLVALAYEPGITESDIRDALADTTQWATADIDTLLANYNYQLADMQLSAWLVKMNKALEIVKLIGVNAAQIWSWNTPAVIFDQASQIRFAVKSKYDNDQWLNIAPDIRDHLREEQRNALLAYVIFHGGFEDADEVYSYYLIDVQMSACMDSSRIKQANLSVQLFVQRVLMNLESDQIEFTEENAKQWVWRKNYRVWEANRKIFLWPENWLSPELRDDKSPFFQELEHELQQDDTTELSVERAYLNYLKKLDQVSQLTVAGSYYDEEQNVYHVFAHTAGIPNQYFYRRWENNAYWTAWEKVDLDIEGRHVLPVLHNRRIYLFWTKFTERAEEPTNSDLTVDTSEDEVTASRPRRFYEIQLFWSQYRNGQWSPKQLSADKIITWSSVSSLPDVEEFYFWADKSDGKLLIHIGFVPADFLTYEVFTFNDAVDVVEVENIGWGVVFNAYLNKILDSDNRHQHWLKIRQPNKLSVYKFAETDYWGQIEESTKYIAELLNNAETDFKTMMPHQYPTYASQAPFFYADSARSFFINLEDIWGYIYFPIDLGFSISKDTYIDPGRYKMVDVGEITRRFANIQKNAATPVGPVNPEIFFDQTENYYQGTAAGNLVIDRSKAVKETDSDTRIRNIGLTYMTEAMTASAQMNQFMSESRTALPLDAKIEPHIDFNDVVFGNDSRQLYWAITMWMKRVWLGSKYHFYNFYHPYTRTMIKQLNRYGIDGLLAPSSDQGSEADLLLRQKATDDYFDAEYEPTNEVHADYPTENFDFTYAGAYSQYNWELFFHVPVFIACSLSQNQKFAEAQKWFHYIFDPTETEGPAPHRFWKIKPFFEYDEETSLARMLELMSVGNQELESQIDAWEQDPFNPHLIARMRIVAYMKYVVMKYLDNLIAWGDYLFRLDTMESINEATQLYVLAAQILGRKPVMVEAQDAQAATFNELLPNLDAMSNALVEIELELPVLGAGESGPGDSSVLASILYFCIPNNSKLLEYWETVADRLFKIRHCLNIAGIRRALALFEPPIEPGLLASAAATGVDLGSVIADLNAPLPYYRFEATIKMAYSFVNDVKALGRSVLSAIERRNAEDLSLIRVNQAVEVSIAAEEIKQKAIEETEENIKLLDHALAAAQTEYDHYDGLEFMNAAEIAATTLNSASIGVQTSAVVMDLIAGILHLIPSFSAGANGFGGSPNATAQTGGRNAGNAARHGASGLYKIAAILDKSARIATVIGRYQRRQETWNLRKQLAQIDIDRIHQQKVAAEVKLEIANKEYDNAIMRTRHAREIADYYDEKFTSVDLYNWMITHLSTLYFQTYQMAYDLAKRAEKCYRHELGIRESNYIQFGYWDSLKKGLLAGDRLQKDLRRLELAYADNNKREYELVKNISLVQLNPVALQQLKLTGSCEFLVPEILFDLDHPSHYFRRIKSVSLTISSSANELTSVSCKLTLLGNRVRINTDTSGGYSYQGIDDARFKHAPIGIKSIATSHAQNDAGLFEVDFGDDRYLPFEGGGVVSSWRLELPTQFQQFDYSSITEVVLQFAYTAREGGDTFKIDVNNELQDSLNNIADILADSDTGLTRILSARNEFIGNYESFMMPDTAASDQVLSMQLSRSLFSFMFKNKNIRINSVDVVLLLQDASDYGGGSPLSIAVNLPDGSSSSGDLSSDPNLAQQPVYHINTNYILDETDPAIVITAMESSISGLAAELIESRDGHDRLNPNTVEDVLVLINYVIEDR
jgi:hypothetical protein